MSFASTLSKAQTLSNILKAACRATRQRYSVLFSVTSPSLSSFSTLQAVLHVETQCALLCLFVCLMGVGAREMWPTKVSLSPINNGIFVLAAANIGYPAASCSIPRNVRNHSNMLMFNRPRTRHLYL